MKLYHRPMAKAEEEMSERNEMAYLWRENEISAKLIENNVSNG